VTGSCWYHFAFDWLFRKSIAKSIAKTTHNHDHIQQNIFPSEAEAIHHSTGTTTLNHPSLFLHARFQLTDNVVVRVGSIGKATDYPCSKLRGFDCGNRTGGVATSKVINSSDQANSASYDQIQLSKHGVVKVFYIVQDSGICKRRGPIFTHDMALSIGNEQQVSTISLRNPWRCVRSYHIPIYLAKEKKKEITVAPICLSDTQNGITIG